MATREQLIEDFADHKYATGEKFARLINSMKVVQEPVETPAASGTSLSFIDSIEQDKDGKITATKKTLDLANAHEINPFKGWWKTGDTLPTSGFDGAYLYFKDTTQTPAVTTIYRWDGTAYADTGTEVDESNVQTFETGQAVNTVGIDNEPTVGSENLVKSGGVKVAIDDLQQDVSNITYKSFDFTTTGYYINWSDGVRTTSSSYKCTDFIKVNKGEKIEIYVNGSDSTAMLAAYSTQEESSYIQSSSIRNVGTSIRKIYVVPEGVNYIRCCCVNGFISSAKLIVSGVDVSLKLSDIELKVLSKNLANPEFIVEDRGIGSAGNIQALSGWAMIVFPVEYGKTYTIGGLSTGRNVYAIYFDNVGPIGSCLTITGSSISTGYIFTPPEGAKYFYCDIKTTQSSENPYATFRINEGNVLLPYDVYTCKIEKILQKKLHTEGDEAIKDIQEELDAAIFDNPKKNSDFIYAGYIGWSDGALTGYAYRTTPFVKVKKGMKVKLNSIYGSSSVAILAAYSTQEQSSYIQSSSVIGTNTAYTGTYEVPEGVNYVRLCANSITENTYYNIIPYVSCLTKDDVAESITDDNNKLATIGIVKENSGSANMALRLYPQTKLPCVSFQFDDIPSNDSQIVSLFESYGLTCAFAFIASTSNIANKASIYLNYQRRGFQIMNHSVDGTVFNTTNYTYQTAQETIFTALNRIQKAGMICNGFVSPSSSMATEFLPILKSCQAYAFTSSTTSPTANGRQQNTCELHRYGIQGGSVGTIKTFIDNCIANNQIITFYGHAADLVDNVPITDETTTFCLDKIAAIIEYCISKRDTGLLYIGGTDDCVKYFFDL